MAGICVCGARRTTACIAAAVISVDVADRRRLRGGSAPARERLWSERCQLWAWRGRADHPVKCSTWSDRWKGAGSSKAIPSVGAAPDGVELLESLRGRVVAIYAVGGGAAPTEGGPTFLGSGFVWVSSCRSSAGTALVATCAHLFEGVAGSGKGAVSKKSSSLRVAVRFGDGRWSTAELLGSSAAADVAVLRIRSCTVAPLEATTGKPLPRPGEWVAVCGGTQHGEETVSLLGVVSQPRQAFRGVADDVGVRFIQVAITTLPGMSGSPVVNLNGEVVGMLAKKFEEHGLALPIARVDAVVRLLERGAQWRPPALGLELEQDFCSGSLDSEFSVPSPRLLVRVVLPGSAALAAGVRAGDVLLSVQGQPVKSLLDVREALAALADETAFVGSGQAASPRAPVLTVERGGKVLELELRAE
eukprot:gnl/TRDRNA2_/TRDRNA2_129616_c0_seq1.p1 gnl/TRDRNA2_/TRDRNA2_129616_c0~~gnl/TRDRNA2_/TRDRNA2_129616_c0_seq1.p1  ORF type:complete len:417 (+),score=63.15 gnl/TRDRNA2_/TRDRNA2_129616_c0_seq1:84-1334(+)